MTDTAKDKKALSDSAKTKAGRKVRLGASTLVALSAFAGYQAYDVVAATATLPMIAKLIRAIEITVNVTLDFGTLAMTVERDGRARIDPEIDNLFIDGNSSLTLAGGVPKAGRVQVKGADFPVAISVADSQVAMTNGLDTVMVGNFNLQTAAGGTRLTVTPSPGSFSFTLPIGATLHTRANQLTGSYTGSTQIFANYQ